MNTVLYFLALFSLSQASNLVKLAQAPPDIIGYWRLIFAGSIFIIWGLLKGDLIQTFKQKKNEIPYVFLTSILFYLHLWTYFYGAQNTSIANCMILFSINPVFATLGSYIVFKEKPNSRFFIAYLFAATGIYFLVKQSIKLNPKNFLGDISALISGFLYASYILSAKRSRKLISNSSYSSILFLLTGLIFGAIAFLKNLNFTQYPTQTWLAILGTVILPTLLGHALFSYLINKMNISLMTCGKLIEPIISSFSAYFLFKETPTSGSYFAFFLTSLSVLILFFPFQKFKRFFFSPLK